MAGKGPPLRPFLRFFYSPTSGPSRRVEALLAKVLQRCQNHGTFALQRVNCDDHPELVERFAVKEMPTLIVSEGDRVRRRLDGPCSCGEIEQLLEPWLRRVGGGDSNGTTSPPDDARPDSSIGSLEDVLQSSKAW